MRSVVSATLEPQIPALGFHLCLAELWSHEQLLFAANFNKLKLTMDLGIHLYFMLWIPTRCFDPDFHKSRFGKAPTGWSNMMRVQLGSQMGIISPAWSPRVAPAARLWAPQQPHILPLNSEQNSLGRTPGLKPKGCPFPQRQWWDVMG